MREWAEELELHCFCNTNYLIQYRRFPIPVIPKFISIKFSYFTPDCKTVLGGEICVIQSIHSTPTYSSHDVLLNKTKLWYKE